MILSVFKYDTKNCFTVLHTANVNFTVQHVGVYLIFLDDLFDITLMNHFVYSVRPGSIC